MIGEQELERLNNLRQAGKISESEYEDMRQKLMMDDSAEYSDSSSQKQKADTNSYQNYYQRPNSQMPGNLSDSTYLALMNFLMMIPTIGWLAPIIIWIVGRESSQKVDIQGKYIINWMITWFLGSFALSIISSILAITIVGMVVFIPALIVIGISYFVFPIIGGIKGLNGEVWRYPISIVFLK